VITKNLTVSAKEPHWVSSEKWHLSTLFQGSRLWMAGVLVATDLGCMLLAVLLAMHIRQEPELITTPAYHQILFLLMIVLAFAFGRTSPSV